jgi:thioredoxin reductase
MKKITDHPAFFTRRRFIKQSSMAGLLFLTPNPFNVLNSIVMNKNQHYDVIIIGGSYAGLAAAMALGRALRNVLVIDGGKPCNIQTPQSHNFLTQDGVPPLQIASIAKDQVQKYDTVSFLTELVTSASKINDGFEVQTRTGETFKASKLVFAMGIKDEMPAIEGFSDCWGISLLHCPYCHGYEVKGLATGIFGNGESGFELAKLISNWTKNLSIYTNENAQFTPEQLSFLKKQNIQIVEKEISRIAHTNGSIKQLVFKDNSASKVNALYARLPFKQNSSLPNQFSCDLTEEGYLKVDAQQRTSVPGIYACGDNSSKMRTVANAVSSGTIAGMMLNKEMIEEQFKK